MEGFSAYEACNICPRSCMVNRMAGEKGFCTQDMDIYISKYMLYFWEEPVISGTNGSGAVFFNGCPLKCVYCQNRKISGAGHETGKKVSVKELSDIFLELSEMKAENINLVTPEHFLPSIIKAMDMSRNNGLEIPFVINTSGYISLDWLKKLKGRADIYLTDLKYLSVETAKIYSKAADYPEIALKAIDEMLNQTGPPEYDGNILKKGVIIRHLLLPGHVHEAEQITEYVYDRYKDKVILSLMSQYTPPLDPITGKVSSDFMEKYPEISRTVTRREYKRLSDFAIRLGIKECFLQGEGTAKESFIPEWDL